MSTVMCFGIGILMACNVPDPPRPTSVVCPPVVEWRTADQKAAAKELEKLPAGHPLRVMARNAVKQRDLVKTCNSAKQEGAAK